MEIVTDAENTKEKINKAKRLMDKSELFKSKGYTCTIHLSKGNTGVFRMHFRVHYLDMVLLEIGVPLSYGKNDNVSSIRGRIGVEAINGEEHYFLLRDPIGLTAKRGQDDSKSGQSISNCVKSNVKSKLIFIGKKEYIKICDLNAFDIQDVIDVLNAVKSCKGLSSPQNISGGMTGQGTVFKDEDFYEAVKKSLGDSEEERQKRLDAAAKKSKKPKKRIVITTSM